MRKVYIGSVVPGTKLAKAVFGPEGRILLGEGVELNEHFLEKLRINGIAEVFIEDDISRDIEIKDVVCDNIRMEAKMLVKNQMQGYESSKAIDDLRINELVYAIIEELLSNDDILINLSDIKSVDDYTFEHSVNVCIFSLITGIGIGYSTIRLKDLGMGALLHDIGKLKIPEEILKKPSQLTGEEFEIIKKHTFHGYEILKSNSNISMLSAYIALGHHERYDGSGYPLQLKGENIQKYARIVAIADVYDALTSNRVYRKKLKPHEVVAYIASLSAYHFDKEIVDTFMRYIAIYPIGTGVVLSTNEIGIVVRVNRNIPSRPVIRVIRNEKKELIDHYYEIDLAKRINVYIVDSCEL